MNLWNVPGVTGVLGAFHKYHSLFMSLSPSAWDLLLPSNSKLSTYYQKSMMWFICNKGLANNQILFYFTEPQLLGIRVVVRHCQYSYLSSLSPSFTDNSSVSYHFLSVTFHLFSYGCLLMGKQKARGYSYLLGKCYINILESASDSDSWHCCDWQDLTYVRVINIPFA